ncbi:ClbS/DfsB family four-helix bundle protein [Frigidibacter sp. RF13]|uniref:ClbS/DfsB family four-helix bundle protein n=1 Tax=Frigidibacter sp. RF13 TaxID=2997340 RepID=UPI00226D9289|nr:ClbS/DfsB family four-helix bundle protein [Frigidibacter sp. RF13]MCY1126570.1 ClbS/DfsB family four-helix bundle protein [Frigidibacter sp. RF13]
MARPTTKTELIEAADTQFGKLLKLISSMNPAVRAAPLFYGPGFVGKEAHWARDRNLRDILVHLYEWDQLLLNWIASNRAGENRPFIPAPYNWKTYGDMNVEIWRKHLSTPCEEAMRLLEESHHKVMAALGQFSNEELFRKGVLTWTGTTTLGSYCVSATSSHYDWAMKKIRAHIKASADL